MIHEDNAVVDVDGVDDEDDDEDDNDSTVLLDELFTLFAHSILLYFIFPVLIIVAGIVVLFILFFWNCYDAHTHTNKWRSETI